MEREHERWKRDQVRRKAHRLEKWQKWRRELLADPDDAFSADKEASDGVLASTRGLRMINA